MINKEGSIIYRDIGLTVQSSCLSQIHHSLPSTFEWDFKVNQASHSAHLAHCSIQHLHPARSPTKHFDCRLAASTYNMMQAHYALYLAVPLVILYIGRQLRRYHEHEVRFYLILRTKCTFNRIAGSKDIRRATRMSTSASNSEPETVGRGSTGADLPRR